VILARLSYRYDGVEMNVFDLNEGKDLLGAPTGVSGMAVGREVAAGGPRRLYFTTREGVLITASPVVAAG
jgi:hypothetical protein